MTGSSGPGLAWAEPALDVISRRYFGRAPVRDDWNSTAWSRACGAALTERLGAVLGEAASAVNQTLPKQCWAALVAARLGAERQTAAHERVLEQLAPGFEKHGLSPVLFKGLAQARHYPAAGVREAIDIDLLVAPDWLPSLDLALRDAGFSRDASPAPGFRSYAVSYTRSGTDADEAIELDVHPSWHEVSLSSDGRYVEIGTARERAASWESGGTIWRVLPSALELYVCVAHAVLHNPRTLSVYLDLAVLLESAPEGTLARVADLSQTSGRERHLRHAVTTAADLFGLEVPREYLSAARRLGVPTSVRLGYLGSRLRIVPSSLVMELVLRRGVRRKLRFARWVLGHGGRVSVDNRPGQWLKRLVKMVRGLSWFKGTILRYRVPGPLPL